MKKLIIPIFILLPLLTFAGIPSTQTWTGEGNIVDFVQSIFSPNVIITYYFSDTGSDSNNGTSTSTPFLTLGKMQTILNNGTVKSNDIILFNRNDTFAGSVHVTTAANNSIYIGAYGTGIKPTLLYSGSGPTADSRYTFFFTGVSGYTFENLNFSDSNHVNDKKTPALCGFAMYLGDSGSDSVFNMMVRYCDFSYVGMGVVFCGSFNTVTHCNMSDFKDLNGGGSPSDYGATSLTVFGNDNELSYCNITGAWAQSLAFGYNGNLVELYGDCSRNKILYNYSYDNGGISEFGGNGSAVATDNIYVGNLVIDCGAFAYATTGQVQIGNFTVYNNVQIETVNSRFSGPNCGHGLPDSATIPTINCDTRSFGYSSTPSATSVFILQNNIFQLSSGMDVCQTGSKTVHTYNAYKLSNGSVSNVTLTGTEFNTSATIFKSTTGNEAFWDYHLAPGSPCLGTGLTILAYPNDVEGNPFANNIGAFGNQRPTNQVIIPGYFKIGNNVIRVNKIQ